MFILVDSVMRLIFLWPQNKIFETFFVSLVIFGLMIDLTLSQPHLRRHDLPNFQSSWLTLSNTLIPLHQLLNPWFRAQSFGILTIFAF